MVEMHICLCLCPSLLHTQALTLQTQGPPLCHWPSIPTTARGRPHLQAHPLTVYCDVGRAYYLGAIAEDRTEDLAVTSHIVELEGFPAQATAHCLLEQVGLQGDGFRMGAICTAVYQEGPSSRHHHVLGLHLQ